MDDLYVLCTLPPKCIMFKPQSTSNVIFPETGSNAISIFSSSTSLKIDNMSVRRLQVPITPAWAVTDYKVQGSTCEAITLDIRRNKSRNRGTSGHNQYCSRYVGLTRVKLRVTLEDIKIKPDKRLLREEQRLADLAAKTDVACRKIESSDEFRFGRRLAPAPL
ncbi:hypothetical protein V8E54_001616 [Elaphomyces granulatus]